MSGNEFGDFQTPRGLAAEVLRTLPRRNWARILEPTCGVGNFLHEAARLFPAAHLMGVELQAEYASAALASGARILERDIFKMRLDRELPWRGNGPLLVVGNPPWVTNSQLARLESRNRPVRENLRNLSGYDAMTGSSNFDIAEYIWLKLITDLRHHSPTISLLCKTQVARGVLQYCAQFDLPVSAASLHVIDARKWFGVAVDACLFTLEVNRGETAYVCSVYDSLDSAEPSRSFGVVDGRLVADIGAYAKAVDGSCPIEWRQGMKHDAAAVMELVHDDRPRTRDGEAVEIEDDYLYPLLKCTDVFRGRTGLRKWVIVPQKAFGEDTRSLERVAPKLWAYLSDNADVLDGRKSSIYRSRPRFSVFGLGEYSFAPYKIAVSGLHKSPEFRLVGPIAGKPVFFDDACYLLPFWDRLEAAAVAALLRTDPVKAFFRTLTFWDAKRPITKKLLRRIDLAAVAAAVDTEEVLKTAEKLLKTPEPSLPETFARMTAQWASAEQEGVVGVGVDAVAGFAEEGGQAAVGALDVGAGGGGVAAADRGAVVEVEAPGGPGDVR